MSNKTTQESILESASRLFASKGYSSVSMRDVATTVGVTPANLYYHFKDKEALIRSSLAHVFAERLSPLEEQIRRHATPDQRLEAFVAWFVRTIFENELFTRLILRELLDGNDERLAYLATSVFQKPFALLNNLIADCGRRPDPALTAASVAGLVLGHYQLARVLPHLPGGRPEHSSVERITRHVLTSLRATLKDGNRRGKDETV